ncbi:Class I SAM-dependent methyltransferase [Candidatus Magnetomoraceae bacterium gMMP-1]
MNIHSIYSPFIRYFRSKRHQRFVQEMNPKLSYRILDVGGYHWFWKGMKCRNAITLLNPDIPELFESLLPQFSYIQGNGRDLPFGENQYDIVFSNSVIEHLGLYEGQKRFATEVRRVGKSYWVQTPNHWFPVEPHLISPLIHYFPKRIQKRLIRWFTIWGLVTRPTKEQINDFISEVRLLTEGEMKELFPDARIVAERFLCFKKSFIAVKVNKAMSR